MLRRTPKYNGSSASTSPTTNGNGGASYVTGQYLAKNHLPRDGRGGIGARILAGELSVQDLTPAQVARLCRTSIYHVIHAGNGNRDAVERALELLARLTPSEREAFARAYGLGRLWDEFIGPGLDTERAE
jgi:hypothetical protein